MAENELHASGQPNLGLDAVEAAGSQDLWLPPRHPARKAPKSKIPGLRSRLIRYPTDGPDLSYVGHRFSLSVNSDLDVEFEFDPDPEYPESPDLRIGFTLLVLVVWCIGVTLGIRFDRLPGDRVG